MRVFPMLQAATATIALSVASFARAETPADFLQSFEAAAKQDAAGFAGFSTQRVSVSPSSNALPTFTAPRPRFPKATAARDCAYRSPFRLAAKPGGFGRAWGERSPL